MSRREGTTASDLGLMGCRDCLALLAGEPGDVCPRCRARVHRRRPRSMQQTWAWTLTAAVLYVPANTLPLSYQTRLGNLSEITLIGSIAELMRLGELLLAGLLFTASVVIPLLKILVVAWVSFESLRAPTPNPVPRLRVLRFADRIGRWSMVDVYVVAMLVALLDIELLAHVRPGPGAACFAGVVIATMCASGSLDPRLLWDREPDVPGEPVGARS